MSGKLMFGGLLAVAVMAFSADTANAQYVVRHGNHYHTVSPGYGYGGGFYQPIYRPVYSTPIYGGGYGYGGGYYSRPIYGGGWGGYPGYYGGGFNTLNFGVYRPGFGANFGFVIR